MKEMIYKRLIIDEIVRYLPVKDVIVLHGARQVGKTYILYYLKELLEGNGEKAYYIDLEDSRFVRILDAGVDEFLKLLCEEGFDPSGYAKGKKRLFVFIDEIHYLANPSSFLKLIADHHPEIKLIVSGSSSFQIKKKFADSLVGRTVDFEIYNLSFSEFLTFKKYRFVPAQEYTQKKIGELKSFYEEYVLYGGYPRIVLTPDIKIKEKYIQQIIDTYIKKDIRDLADIKDVGKFNRLLEALAPQSGQLLNVAELSNTCGIAKQTVENYLFLLEQTYIIRLIRPFSRNLRSELSKMPKVFFYDTGLMQMLWLKGLPKGMLGQVFETSIFAELVKKHGPENISYWRTADKKEIDFILREGKACLPIEVKLNFAQFKQASVQRFMQAYKARSYKVIGLHGRGKDKSFIYPWQL